MVGTAAVPLSVAWNLVETLLQDQRFEFAPEPEGMDAVRDHGAADRDRPRRTNLHLAASTGTATRVDRRAHDRAAAVEERDRGLTDRAPGSAESPG